MSENTITIRATVNADKIKVWNYYTQPKNIIHWNFASDDWHCPSASNNMIVGGLYSARMEAKDGSFGFDFEAVYNEIVDGEKFIYTMPNHRTVHVLFHQVGEDATEVEITFDIDQENPIEFQRAGWQAILDNFKHYVETH